MLNSSEVNEKYIYNVTGGLYKDYMQRIHLLYSIGTKDEEIPKYLKNVFVRKQYIGHLQLGMWT